VNSVSRPAPCELETDHYPFVTDVLPRFSDLDINAHVNNVSIANLFEEGRLKFSLHYRKVTFNGLVECEEKILIVSSLISYIGEVFYPDPVKEYLWYSRHWKQFIYTDLPDDTIRATRRPFTSYPGSR